jgi:hypothetical protein
MVSIIYPSIKVNKKIYIPRKYKPITKEYILNEYNNKTINKITIENE